MLYLPIIDENRKQWGERHGHQRSDHHRPNAGPRQDVAPGAGPGRAGRKLVVKVVDIFGNDTMAIVEVQV